MAADTLRTLVWLWHQGGKVCRCSKMTDMHDAGTMLSNILLWISFPGIVSLHRRRERKGRARYPFRISAAMWMWGLCPVPHSPNLARKHITVLISKWSQMMQVISTLSGMPSAEQEFTFKLNYECFCRVSKRETRGREGWMTVSFQFPGAQCPNRRTQR